MGGATAQRAQLLEREEEQAALQALLDRAATGEGGVVLLEGAAGIGKTRLLHAARELARERDIRVLGARGTELEREFPFGLVRQLFEPVVHAASPDERRGLLEGTARLAGVVLGVAVEVEVATSNSPLDPSFATLNALYWLTSNLAEATPVLLLVDDAHWTDEASLRFLRFLLPRIEELPVALVISARPAEPGAALGPLAELSADPAAQLMRPSALSQAAVGELVRAQLSTADDAFSAACREATGGNPFMLRELLIELAAEGSAGRAAEAADVRGIAPSTIQRAVLTRLARLPQETHGLARAVAVLGDDADPAQAAALADLERQAAATAADSLAAAGVLEPSRPLRFVHPLVRNAVYADLSPSDRSDAHRQAARLLADGRAEPERIAVHLLATDPEGDVEVVELLDAAARRAVERAAPEAAVAYLRRALAEPAGQPERTRLLARLMTASVVSMDPRALDELPVDVVEELTADPQLLLSSASELAPLLLTYGRGEEGAKLLYDAREAAIAARDYDLLVRFEAQTVMWRHLSPVTAAARLDRYADVIEPGTPAERMWLAMKALAGAFSGEPAADVAELARRAVDNGMIFREQLDGVISSVPIYVLLRADELDVAERAMAQYGAEGQAHGGGFSSGAAFIRGELAFARGDVARAEPDVRAAVDAARTGGFLVAFPSWTALLVDVLVERDELAAAERDLLESGLAADLPDDLWFDPVLLSRGRLRLAQGRSDEGIGDLLAMAERAARHGAVNAALLPAAAVTAIALARAGQEAPAKGLADLYHAAARSWGTRRAIGISLHCLGVVEAGAKGIDLMRESVEVLEGSPARLDHAKALTDLGAALRRSNRRAEAREPLRQALELARRLGALAVAREAHDELEATGEKLGPFLVGGAESLTPSERRIAGLAAEGLTNRRIAQALFLSVKTVESHLRGAYRKLDIGRRSELTQALGEK